MNQAQVVLPIAFPTLLLILAATFLLPLPLTPLWLLRGCPALRPLFLALRHRRALLTLCRPWRWLLPGAYLLTLSRQLLPGAYLLTLSRRLLPGAYVLTLSRRLRPPSAKVHRGPPVVADRNSQDEYRHRLPSHNPPGSVVPGARVPVIPLVDPVHAIVEEVVCLHARGVVDRVARHRDQFRVQRQVDPDAHVGTPYGDAHLSDGRGHRAQ